jgi:hypothetical protein
VFEAPTNSIFFGIRLLSTDEAQREKDLAAIKIYPLSEISSPGQGQIYLGAYRDADGDWLDGANYYGLHVPAKCACRRVLVCDGL